MARKPVPGHDVNVWGNILNEFLDVAHNEDGTIRAGVVGSDNLTPGLRSQIATGGSAPTNLASQPAPGHITITSSTGAAATIAPASTTNAGVLSASDKAKLDSVNPASYVRTADLHEVATSGDYSDLSNTPSLHDVATTGNYNDLNNTPDPGVAYVTVTSGSEVRPNANLVLWIGGDNQPANMATHDIWFKAAE